MTLLRAIEIIEKSQGDITDKVLLGEEPYPPDEYFIAVGKVVPMLKCLNCLSSWASKDASGDYIPRCEDENNFRPDLQQDADELPSVSHHVQAVKSESNAVRINMPFHTLLSATPHRHGNSVP